MKISILLGLAIVAGVIGGYVLAQNELAHTVNPVTAVLQGSEIGPSVAPSDDLAVPIIDVEGETTFDFGTMEHDEKRSHTFVLFNRGNAPLLISKVSTSCKCTAGDLTNRTIPPNGRTELELNWSPNVVGSNFRQTATVRSNAANKPEFVLAVTGDVVQSIRSSPSTVDFTGSSPELDHERDFRIYNYLDAKMTISKISFENTNTAKSLSATYRPLTVEELEIEENALSGMLVTVKLKAGMPLGAFEQTLTFATERGSRFVVPINGTVKGDFSFIKRQNCFFANETRLELLKVIHKEEFNASFLVLVKGKYSEDIQLQLAEVSPPFVEVTIDDRKPFNNGKVVGFNVNVRIPANAPRTELTDKTDPQKQGRIVFSTNHPKHPKITLQVRLAIR